MALFSTILTDCGWLPLIYIYYFLSNLVSRYLPHSHKIWVSFIFILLSNSLTPQFILPLVTRNYARNSMHPHFLVSNISHTLLPSIFLSGSNQSKFKMDFPFHCSHMDLSYHFVSTILTWLLSTLLWTEKTFESEQTVVKFCF